MLENLPTKTIDYRLTDGEQVCLYCGDSLHEMSTEVHRELKIVTAQVKVFEHASHIYIVAGNVNVREQKHVEGPPLYRQEKQLARIGVALSRQTLANWMMYGVTKGLNPMPQNEKSIYGSTKDGKLTKSKYGIMNSS